uniref:Sodium/bile acid cotransporter 4-like n=1 Tax=Phallusia mammillata TaxID=59560 RepID=A0A6F9DRM0_9ASCI|nr:sodium/bile acid cotransporter 4-like [Phallusia mammillata]
MGGLPRIGLVFLIVALMMSNALDMPRRHKAKAGRSEDLMFLNEINNINDGSGIGRYSAPKRAKFMQRPAGMLSENATGNTSSMSSSEGLASSATNKPESEPTYSTETSTLIDDDISEVVERIQKSPGLNSGIEAILVLLVIQTMLGLGCTIDLSVMKEHLLEPGGIAIAAACQFGIMPLVAFGMSKMFGLDKVAAIAVIVTGSCPGGNLSNLLTYFLYGDVNLSVLMSTISTLLALILMPLCLFIYGSSWIDVSVIGGLVPFGGVVLTLIMTLFPVALGIALKAKYDKIANTVLKISLFSVGVSFIALMTLSGIMFGTTLFDAISGKTYLIAMIMPLIGYATGYLLATGIRLPDASRRTVAIETGCQNSQLSSTILKMAFAKETMGAYFLFPVYYALFQGLEGLGMIIAFRIYRRYYADESIAPAHTRITYDRFEGGWGADVDGEDMMPNRLYQQPSTSGSEGSMYGRMANDASSDRALVSSLPLKHKYSPGEAEKTITIESKAQKEATDKSALVKDQGQSSEGVLDYGGLGDRR